MTQAVNVLFSKPSIPPSSFGFALVHRSRSGEKYRFGFNGKEKDNEVKGDGNSLDFGARIYDSRLGRWLSLDPLQAKYPSLSPYCFVGNMPISAIDPNGKEIWFVLQAATTPMCSGHSLLVVTTYKEVMDETGKGTGYYEKTGVKTIQNWPNKGVVVASFKDMNELLSIHPTITATYQITSPNGVSGDKIGLDPQKTYYAKNEVQKELDLEKESNVLVKSKKMYEEGVYDCSSIVTDLLNKIKYVADPKFGTTEVDGKNFSTPNDLALDLSKKGVKPVVSDKKSMKNVTRKNSKEYIESQRPIDE